MCKALIEWERDAKEEGQEIERIMNIRKLMESLGIMAENAMELLQIPHEEQGRYLEILSRN